MRLTQHILPCRISARKRRWSGLIRGAVSVALVYYHFDPQGKSEDAKRATLITTTLLVVLFSILVCGALTKPLLQLLLEPQGTFACMCLDTPLLFLFLSVWVCSGCVACCAGLWWETVPHRARLCHCPRLSGHALPGCVEASDVM